MPAIARPRVEIVEIYQEASRARVLDMPEGVDLALCRPDVVD